MSLLSAVGAGLFAAGVGAGWWACRDREARARADELARELEAAERDLTAYREQVEQHFSQTSRLFRELTGRYTSLYTHLADGARELCRSQPPALGVGTELEAMRRLGVPQPATPGKELKSQHGG